MQSISQSRTRGLRKDVVDGNSLNDHFLKLHKYLETIEADNYLEKGRIRNGFNAVMNQGNQLWNEKDTNTERLKHVITDFVKFQRKTRSSL